MAGGGNLVSITGSANATASGAAADAVIVLAAVADKYWLIPGLIYSYDQLPGVVGGITISDGVFTYQWDEVSNGSFHRPFEPHLRGGLGLAVTITLKSGGAGVTGKLNIMPGPYQQG
jgi:hypothetical protein